MEGIGAEKGASMAAHRELSEDAQGTDEPQQTQQMLATGSVKDSLITLGIRTRKSLLVHVSHNCHDFPLKKAINQDKFLVTLPHLFKYLIVRHKFCF